MTKITDKLGNDWEYRDGVIRYADKMQHLYHGGFQCSSFEDGVRTLQLFGYVLEESNDED